MYGPALITYLSSTVQKLFHEKMKRMETLAAKLITHRLACAKDLESSRTFSSVCPRLVANTWTQARGFRLSLNRPASSLTLIANRFKENSLKPLRRSPCPVPKVEASGEGEECVSFVVSCIAQS